MTLRSDLPLPILHSDKPRKSHRALVLAAVAVIAVGGLGYEIKGSGFRHWVALHVYPTSVTSPSTIWFGPFRQQMAGLLEHRAAPVQVPGTGMNVPSIVETVPADCS